MVLQDDAGSNTDSSRSLIITRLAFVDISQAAADVRICTNNVAISGARAHLAIIKFLLQEGGMRTAQLGQIMRQKDLELLQAVQYLAGGGTAKGVKLLAYHCRVTEVIKPQGRSASIARDYAAKPSNTIIVSPDNRSRQQINDAVQTELQATGALDFKSLSFAPDPSLRHDWPR